MQSLLSALRVLEEVAARQPAGVSELARALNIPKSSVHRILSTLRESGWVRSTGGELPRYLLTSRALTIGRSASAETGLREAALPEMQQLRDVTEETIHLSLRESDDVVLIERVDCRQAVRTFHALGTHAPLHASASGKAVLAMLASADIDRIIDLGLHSYTGATVVDETAVRTELAGIRRRGYAINNGEWRPEVSAVAAAVCGSDGQPLGAINVSAPASRTTPEDLVRYGALLVQACAAVEERLGLRPRS